MQSKFIQRILLAIGFVFLATALFASNDDETDQMISLYLKAISKAFNGLNAAQSQSVTQIVTSFLKYGDRDWRKLSYILATAWHESKLMLVKEKRAAAGTRLYDIQEKYWPSGYYGRGYVQLTHDYNYKSMGIRLGIDLINNPDLALDKRYAADILVVGMMEGFSGGRKLIEFINNTTVDYYAARKVVNGIDQAQLIADYTDRINNSLEFQIV